MSAETLNSHLFPGDIRSYFDAVWNETVGLHFHWKLYLDLFSSSESIETLNATAPAAFHLIEESLRTTLAVSICRLLDPPKDRKFENLSLQQLVESLRGLCEEQFYASLKDQLTAIRLQCEPIDKFRNKRVAHNDLNTLLSPHQSPLPGIKQSTITDALRLIAKLMNGIELHFLKSETNYLNPIHRGTGADLVFRLKQGLKNDVA